MKKTLLTIALLLVAAPAFASDPPKVKGYVSAEEHEALKARVAQLEKQLAAKSAAPCVCGDSCKCDKGSCPGRCPTAKPAPVRVPNPASALPATLTIGGVPHARGADGVYYPSGSAPANYGTTCTGAGCPGAPSIVRTGGYVLPAQSCPNGKCPVR